MFFELEKQHINYSASIVYVYTDAAEKKEY